jgi:tight adherence protein C
MLMWVILGVVLVGGAIVLIVIGIRAPDPADALQARLAEYSTREQPMTLEELELSLPFSQRIIAPIVRRLADQLAQMTPEKTLEATNRMLELAGNPYKNPGELMVRRVAGAVIGAVLGFVGATLAKQPGIIALAAMLGAGYMGFQFPGMALQSTIRSRKDSITKSLPDALDLLTICVEAGLGFDAAMGKVTEKWDNVLSKEFGRVLHEIRLGKTRREALRDMAERTDVPDVISFVAALIQADQLGVSIAKVLRIQSDQMRLKRRQRAEEKAHQAPIKMIFPMVFLIFPSIYLVLLGPAGLILMETFGEG